MRRDHITCIVLISAIILSVLFLWAIFSRYDTELFSNYPSADSDSVRHRRRYRASRDDPEQNKVAKYHSRSRQVSYSSSNDEPSGGNRNIPDAFRSVWEPESRRQILTLILYFHQFCQKYQISYCIMYGTLLGKVRHNELIPWDDDADCCAGDEIHSYYPLLENQKIGVTTWGQHKNYYKIFFKNNPKIKSYSWSWPFLDIFPVQTVSTQQFIVPPRKKLLLSRRDVFPATLSTLETVPVMLPAKPNKLLNAWYGPHWKTKCLSGEWRHRLEKSVQNYTRPCHIVMV